ncbi:MAG: hypothetical protein OXU23_23445 [Candidatus Poribacteria bacterium]|nr:hypothetical protein [Candidatus Poribacteria bacterium]
MKINTNVNLKNTIRSEEQHETRHEQNVSGVAALYPTYDVNSL